MHRWGKAEILDGGHPDHPPERSECERCGKVRVIRGKFAKYYTWVDGKLRRIGDKAGECTPPGTPPPKGKGVPGGVEDARIDDIRAKLLYDTADALEALQERVAQLEARLVVGGGAGEGKKKPGGVKSRRG